MPHEYLAECFSAFYKSGQTRQILADYAPKSFEALQKLLDAGALHDLTCR